MGELPDERSEAIAPGAVPVAQSEVNQRSLQSLIRSLEFSQGQFSLILARCNYANLRQAMVAQLHQRSSVPIQTLRLEEDVTTLYTNIQAFVGSLAEPPRALMVLGLDSVSALNQVLISTNQVRDEFRKFKFPLILWVNNRVFQQMATCAIDFRSWAISSKFELPVEALIQEIRHHGDRLFASILDVGDDWAFSERVVAEPGANLQTLRQAELEFALNDILQAGGPLDAALQANLDFLLGRTAHSQGDITTARECYESSLEFWRRASAQARSTVPLQNLQNLDLHPPAMEREACLLFHLGMCWRAHAVLQRTRYPEANRYAELCFRQSLLIFEQENRQELVARFITAREEVLQKLGGWEALEVLAQRAIVLHQLYQDPIRRARDHGFLAEVWLARENWVQAREQAKTALQILNTVEVSLAGDADLLPVSWALEAGLELAQRFHRGWYLLLLARAEARLEQRDAAIAYLQEAQIQSLPKDDPQLYIQILQALQNLYFVKERYLDAFHIKQDQRAVEHQYGFRAFVGALRLQPQESLSGSSLLGPASESVSAISREHLLEEITTSGRQQDIQRLVGRMTRSDCKLTVIHGPSGVGKSSIVHAGLAPALKDYGLGDRTLAPVVIERYTDWQTHLYRQLLAISGPLEPFAVESPMAPGPGLPIANLLKALQQAIRRKRSPVLIFDQFEEFFFVYDQPQKCRDFYRFLQDCLNLPYVKVVMSLREDYLHYLLEFQQMANLEVINNDILSKEIRYPLGDFSLDDARTVIQSLTAKAQFYLAPDLIEAVVQDLAGDLGAVRPIELQVVGAQLQADNITTLEQYRQLGPKQQLVERSLEAVVQDCGPKNEQIARLVLFLLTNDNGTRPLKTWDELEADLLALDLGTEVDKLELVLEVLVGSGLVFLIKETPADRYQLVHDYLVSFIRQHREFVLIGQLEEERERRRLTEEQLRQALQKEQRERRRAEVAELEALSSLSQALWLAHHHLEALVTSLQAGKKLRKTEVSPEQRTAILGRLWHATHRIYAVNRLPHKASVWDVDISPDGHRLVSACADHMVRLWDQQGQLLQVLKGHDAPVRQVRFSPLGHWIASASEDKTVKIWQLDGSLCHTLEGHQLGVWAIAFSPDGQLLASGSMDGEIKLWRDGDLLTSFKAHNARVYSLAFSPDGQWLASGSADKTAKLWSMPVLLSAIPSSTASLAAALLEDPITSPTADPTADPTAEPTVTAEHRWEASPEAKAANPAASPAANPAANPEVNLEANPAASPALRSLAADPQACQLTLQVDRDWEVCSLCFNADGSRLATASKDRTIRIWNLQGKACLVLRGHQAGIGRIAYSPDGQILASASEDGTIKLWDPQERDRGRDRSFSPSAWQTLQGHQAPVRSLRFHPQKQVLLSGSDDGTAKLWRLQRNQPQTLRGHQDWVWSASFNPAGDRIVTGSSDHSVKLWDRQGQLLQTLEGHTDWVRTVRFSPDGQWIASAGADNTLRLWTVEGELRQTFLGHQSGIWTINFSPDGQLLASASSDRTVRLWRLDGTQFRCLDGPQGHQHWVRGVSFSPNGQFVASASADKTVIVWSLEGEKILQLKGHRDWVWTVNFSPNGELLASASDDNTVKIWSIDGQEVQTLQGHRGGVWGVCFSPDGRLLASASEDQTIKLWSLDGRELYSFEGHTDWVWSIGFSPDGQTLISASADKTAILWDLCLDRLLRQSCEWLHDYLQTNAPEGDRHLCQGLGPSGLGKSGLGKPGLGKLGPQRDRY